MHSPASISLADLTAAGLRLRPIEAVTVVRELARQVTRGELPGVPSAHVIRFTASGQITVEGPVDASGRGVSRAAQLLEALLPGFDAPPEFRVPGALRLVTARALGTLDLPPYPSLQAFTDALARFGAAESQPVVRALVKSWSAAAQQAPAEEPAIEEIPEIPAGALTARVEPMRQEIARPPAPLTISDIRRARRATGLTLADIADRSRIPAWLLRELEWGYVRNWPSGTYGRTQLVRYARASGLDDQVVVRTVWPMLEEAARTSGPDVVPAAAMTEEIIEAEEVTAQPWDAVPVVAATHVPTVAADGRTRRHRMLAALAIPALLAIGLVPALMNRGAGDDVTAPAAEEQTIASRDTGASPTAPASAGSDVPVAPARTVESAAAPPQDLPVVTPASTGAASGVISEPRPARGLTDATAYSPAFASVGSAMFYHAEADGQSTLMRADTDSRGAILRVTSVVDDNARNFHARPSPDGTRIAFDSDRDGERAVYVADADGKNVRRVSGEGFAAIPSWAPDGQTLAYVRAEADRPRVWNLWTADLESGQERRVTSFKVGQPWGGSWFPDGRRIAYSHETRLIIRDLSSGRERVYPSPVKGRLVRTPAVSPDGRRVLFQVYRDGAWLLDVQDGSMRKVLSDPSAEEYTWSPDGRRVAYHSRRSGNWGVWVMSAR